MKKIFTLFAIGAALTFAGQAAAADKILVSPQIEAEQLAILRSDAPPGQKAIACKKLAIDGSSAAVPELVKLLSNPELSSWARIALEAIPGAEADLALRTAAGSLDGLLLVGTLNSIGVRRDAGAVELLTTRLLHNDAEVASAAAIALGRIGNALATSALRAQLGKAPTAVRSAVAEGCILCAERLMADGKLADAAELYDEVRKADVVKQRKIEATRGAILARQQDGLPLLLEQLRGADKQMFQIALSTAREFPGNQIDKALVNELNTLSADKAAAVIAAMADRRSTVDLASIINAATKGAKPVRLAAIVALAKVGDDSCVDTLLKTVFDADAELSQAAQQTLSDLPGKAIDAKIVEQLASADAKLLPRLFVLVGQRRIAAVPTLIKALDHADQAVRNAALTALGETVELSQLNLLVASVLTPKQPSDLAAAETALKAASVRMPDRNACAAELSQAMSKAPEATRILLLEIIGEVGGDKALAIIASAAKSDDPMMQDAGSRVLGKWNGVDAAPVLLDLAKTGPAPQYRTRALRAYIGLARKFNMPENQRAAMCQTAFDLSRQVAEQKLVLDVLKLHANKDTLAVAIKVMAVPSLKSDATQAVTAMVQKMKAKGRDVTTMLANAGFEKVKLVIVKAEYGFESSQLDVTPILKKHAGDSPLIVLPNASYSASFGDNTPAAGARKLKIQYQMNGKAGEATFADDAIILLPTP